MRSVAFALAMSVALMVLILTGKTMDPLGIGIAFGLFILFFILDVMEIRRI